jgi:hypothetical protein
MNSHDGFIVYHEQTFYHYGIVQPNCIGSPLCKGDKTHCGWGPNTVALHSSTDLAAWLHHTDDVLDGRYCKPGSRGCTNVTTPSGDTIGKCGVFLPKVLYNKVTNLFVMWWTCLVCSVATSPTPTGPWTIRDWNVTYADGKQVCKGSINFFIDDDGEGTSRSVCVRACVWRGVGVCVCVSGGGRGGER